MTRQAGMGHVSFQLERACCVTALMNANGCEGSKNCAAEAQESHKLTAEPDALHLAHFACFVSKSSRS